MINIIQKPELIITRDGKYDRKETWKPAIKKSATNIAQVIDRLFVEHKL